MLTILRYDNACKHLFYILLFSTFYLGIGFAVVAQQEANIHPDNVLLGIPKDGMHMFVYTTAFNTAIFRYFLFQWLSHQLAHND